MTSDGRLRIHSANAHFQQLESLLHNRNRRTRERRMLVQGVRPISLAIEHGWELESVLFADGRRLSDWARGILAATTEPVAVRPELLARLAEKPDGEVELVAVVRIPSDDLGRIPTPESFLGLLFDRASQPGNIGSILRSADAFGADGVIVTGHAADVYDPRSVRASTGSLFAVPAVRAPAPADVLAWVADVRDAGCAVRMLAMDEDGDEDIWDCDLTGPVLVLIGNETTGLARSWREAADITVRIPMGGSASSLNAANAAALVLYEAKRQRAAAGD